MAQPWTPPSFLGEAMTSLRMILLGYGWAASMHARAAKVAGIEVVGVAGHNIARAQTFAETHGIAHVTEDWRTLVAEPNVDLVLVATPNALHHPQAMHALTRGKHVLVEKPMALTGETAKAMIEAAKEAERILAVGHMWRYREEVMALRQRIGQGEFGRIVRTHGFGIHAKWGPSGWFTEPTLAGGGALIDMGIHAIDTARFLLGDPVPLRVQATIGKGMFGDYPVDDDGLVIVDWEGGIRSLVEFGWHQPRLGGLEAETEVLGTLGAAKIWPDMPPVPVGYEHCSVPMYAAQLADVANCCETKQVPACSAEVGFTALRIVELAYRANDQPLTPLVSRTVS